MNPTQPPRRASPRSSDRVLQLLRLVGSVGQGISLSEAAAEVDLPPSTTLRQLRSLEASGMVERDPDSQLYRPGAELVRLAYKVVSDSPFLRLGQPALDQLARATGESTYLAVQDGPDHAMYVATAPGAHDLRHTGWLGQRLPVSGTAVGAALSGEVDGDGAVTRESGYERGVLAISAPVRNGAAEIVGAISLLGPTFRLEHEAVALRGSVAAAALGVSRQLGFN